MPRRSIMPPIAGCTSKDGARLSLLGAIIGYGPRAHRWEHTNRWNGNSKKVLPFEARTSGISRSGWRCYHCGKFVWDEPDDIYALKQAYYNGMLPDFRELMAGTDLKIRFQSDDSFEHGARISKERGNAA